MSKTSKSIKKPIGFFNMLSMVVGTMIGTGIFIAPVLTMKYGFYGALSCMLAGLLCTGLAIMFGDLSKISFASGPAGFVFQAFGKFSALQASILHWLGFTCAQVLTIHTLGVYLNLEYAYYIAITMLIAVSIINIFFPRLADSMQVGLTVLKVGLVLFVIVVGLSVFKISDFKLSPLPLQQAGKTILSGLTCFLIAFAGLELATLPSGEVKNPKFTVPAATILGTVITAILSACVYIVIMNVLIKNHVTVSARPVYDVLNVLVNKHIVAGFVMLFAIACVSSVNGILSAQSYILRNAAVMNIMPSIFKQTNRSDQPVFAVLFSVIANILLLMMMQCNVVTMNAIGLISALSFSMVYFFATMSYLKLKGSKILWLINIMTAMLFLYGVVLVSSKLLVLISLLILLGLIL